MARFTEFADILVKKIRSEETHNFKRPIPVFQSEFDSDPAHLSYLMGQLNTQKNPAPGKNPYARRTCPKVKVDREAEPKADLKVEHKTEPRPHALSEAQERAVSQWQGWGLPLRPDFRHLELKQGFRVLAKRLHPDMPGGSGTAFIALKESYRVLSALFA